jgi:Arylsulfotransferase (ASST)
VSLLFHTSNETWLLESALSLNPGQAGSGYNSSDAWDYFHINSVDKDFEGNYLLSARDTCTIYKVNRTDGSIAWRLAGKASSFRLGHGVDFCFQHHARWLAHGEGKDIEIISLYDNSAHGTEHDGGHEVHTAATSKGKIVRLNTTSWEATLIQSFFPPDNLRSKSQGSTQILPNGNALVNWGSEGAITEFLPDGTAIFHAYLDSGDQGVGVENYRAFRFNWTGLPNEDPAIVALSADKGTDIYVSWNGDTETKKWQFFALPDDSHDSSYTTRHFLGEVHRKSFETVLHVEHAVRRVSADAIDAQGKVLRSTAIARAEPKVLPAALHLTSSSRPPMNDAEVLLPPLGQEQKTLAISKSCWVRCGWFGMLSML